MKMTKRSLIVIFIMLTCSNIFGAPKINCNNPIGSYEESYCSEMAFKKTDKQLNEIYKKYKSMLNNEEAKLLLKSQKGWIELRDGQCELLSYESKDTTGCLAEINDCFEEITAKRVKELNIMLKDKIEMLEE